MSDSDRPEPAPPRWDLSGPVAPRGGEEGGKRPRVLLVEAEQPDLGSLRDLLGDEFHVVAIASDAAQALTLVRRCKPELVLVHLRLLGVRGLDLVQQIALDSSGALPIVVAPDRSVDLMRRAMQAGAREYLVEPLRAEEVIASLHLLLRRSYAEEGEGVLPERPHGSGTWCFTSAVGGVGRTTLLLALADGLRAEGRRVAVVDLNRMFGDLGFFLDLEAEGMDLGNLVRDFPRGAIPPLATLDYGRDHKSGFRVFLPPPTPAGGAAVPPDRLVEVVGALTEVFDFVLVDFPPGIPEEFLPILETARYVFVQGDDRLAAVKNVVAMVDLLGQLEIEPLRIRPVLARLWGDPEGPERYRRHLAKVPAAELIELPQDRIHVDDAVLGGEPLTRRSPKSPYAAAARIAVDELTGAARHRRVRAGSRTQRLLRRFILRS